MEGQASTEKIIKHFADATEAARERGIEVGKTYRIKKENARTGITIEVTEVLGCGEYVTIAGRRWCYTGERGGYIYQKADKTTATFRAEHATEVAEHRGHPIN